MPLPSPKGKQDKNSFVSSCMNDAVMKKEFSDPKQRAAVCHSKWKKSKGTIELDFTDQIKKLDAEKDNKLTPDEFEKVFKWVKKVGAYSHKVIDIRPEKKEVVIEDGLGNQFVMPEKKVIHHLIEDHGLSLSLLKRIANEGPEKALKGYKPKKL
jgi:hypothetical protein